MVLGALPAAARARDTAWANLATLEMIRLLSSLGGLASVAAGSVLIEPWGADSVRVRLTIDASKTVVRTGLPGALDEHPPAGARLHDTEQLGSDGQLVTNGNIQASYDDAGLVVTRVSDGVELARSLSISIEPCGTVPPLSSSNAITPLHNRATAASHASNAVGAAATCAANVQIDSDWGHNDILVDGKLHPYESHSIADCCARCQSWRPLAGTQHCGGFSWSGPNTTVGPKNMCFLKYGVGKGSHSVGRFSGCVAGANCTAPPPPPAPPPPAPVPEGCTTKAVARFSWLAGMDAYGTGEHMNTHAIPGRLPSGKLDINATLPSTDMVGGSWDFQSCTVYSDSSGAEICIPWVIAATPGQSYEYGMLWNMPNFGSMTLEKTQTTWVAHDPVNSQLDIFFTTCVPPSHPHTHAPWTSLCLDAAQGLGLVTMSAADILPGRTCVARLRRQRTSCRITLMQPATLLSCRSGRLGTGIPPWVLPASISRW